MRWARVVGGAVIVAVALAAAGPWGAAARPPAADPAATGSQAKWSWPLAAPPSPDIVAPYVAPATAYSAGHRGIDLGAVGGAAVAAPSDAVVRFSGLVVDRPVVTLDHGGSVLSSYEPVDGMVPVGTPVARGTVIGSVASGGHCDGRCLHVGVRVDGQYVSPMLFFGRVPPAILLPLGWG